MNFPVSGVFSSSSKYVSPFPDSQILFALRCVLLFMIVGLFVRSMSFCSLL